MNYLKPLSILVLFLGIFQAGAQTALNQDMSLKNPDNPAKCKNIREGKFLRDNYPEGIWYMTIKDNVQTEYFNGGKDFIKSSIVFLDDCNYKTIVIEKTDKNDPTQIGDVVSNKVVQTEGDYLRIRSKVDNQEIEKKIIKVK
ncbi:hypothetical protein [Chryseobacterium gossypii]|uniref:hypothetical protein n=1 Tax=Chryseobacterium gossypii TaxID=3231602 RepID=UPI0035254909